MHGEINPPETPLQNGPDWRAGLSGVFETAGSLEQLRAFRGAQSHLATGRFAISRLTATTASLLPSDEKRLDFYGLLLAPAGGATFSIGASHQEVTPQTLRLFNPDPGI